MKFPNKDSDETPKVEMFSGRLGRVAVTLARVPRMRDEIFGKLAM